jgi:hypothetical protein
MFAPQGSAGWRGPVGVPAVAGCIVLLLLGAQTVRYAAGPFGYRTGFPGFWRLFSQSPHEDVSTGQKIVSFEKKITLPMPARYIRPSYDGQFAIFLTKNDVIGAQRLHRVDVETGVASPMPMLADSSARSVAFSPDGRYIAVNLEGRRRERNFSYGRIRLLTIDGMTEVGNLWAEEQRCALDSEMTFSTDSTALWVLCRSSQAQSDDLIAVKLRVPDLTIVERHAAPAGTQIPRPLSKIAAGEQGIFASGYVWDKSAQYLSVLDVTGGRTLLASRDVSKDVMDDRGFGFCGVHLARQLDVVTVAHCGISGTFKTDAYLMTGQFRSFNVSSGRLVADFARQVRDRDVVRWNAMFDAAHGRVAGVGTTLSSNIGALVIWDQRTGAELQRIETRVYRSGTFSADGRRLLLIGDDEREIYVYRAGP